VLVFNCGNGLAPLYLEFRRVADMESRQQQLRLASPAELIIPRVRRATIGGRAFPVTDAHVWNTLRLKTELFTQCYGAMLRTSIHLAHLSHLSRNFITV